MPSTTKSKTARLSFTPLWIVAAAQVGSHGNFEAVSKQHGTQLQRQSSGPQCHLPVRRKHDLRISDLIPRREVSFDFSELGVAETIDGMVVHHAGGLHEGVSDGGADEFEAAFEKGFAHGV